MFETQKFNEKFIREELESKTKQEIIDAIIQEYNNVKKSISNEKDEKYKEIFKIQLWEIHSILNIIII